jgi:hypothetical protein
MGRWAAVEAGGQAGGRAGRQAGRPGRGASRRRPAHLLLGPEGEPAGAAGEAGEASFLSAPLVTADTGRRLAAPKSGVDWPMPPALLAAALAGGVAPPGPAPAVLARRLEPLRCAGDLAAAAAPALVRSSRLPRGTEVLRATAEGRSPGVLCATADGEPGLRPAGELAAVVEARAGLAPTLLRAACASEERLPLALLATPGVLAGVVLDRIVRPLAAAALRDRPEASSAPGLDRPGRAAPGALDSGASVERRRLLESCAERAGAAWPGSLVAEGGRLAALSDGVLALRMRLPSAPDAVRGVVGSLLAALLRTGVRAAAPLAAEPGSPPLTCCSRRRKPEDSAAGAAPAWSDEPATSPLCGSAGGCSSASSLSEGTLGGALGSESAPSAPSGDGAATGVLPPRASGDSLPMDGDRAGLVSLASAWLAVAEGMRVLMAAGLGRFCSWEECIVPAQARGRGYEHPRAGQGDRAGAWSRARV